MNNFAIIEMVLENEDNYIVSCCNVLFSKSGFTIKDSIYNLKSIEELPDYIFKKTIYLSIHGRGVITKDNNQIASMENIISDNKTYTQTFELNDYKLVSLIRQDLLNHYLNLLFEKKLSIKKILIGASPLLHLFRNYKETSKDIYRYKFSIDIQNQIKISSVSSPDITFEYNSIHYPTEQSIFICVLLTVLKNSKVEDQFDRLLELSSHFYYFRYYKLAQKTVLFFFFFLLILNFSFFMSLSSDSTSGTGNIKNLKLLKTKRDSLKMVINNQELKFGVGATAFSNLSFLIDRIASSIPVGVKLTEINLNPSKFSRERGVFLYEKNRILLYGSSDNSYILNQWVKSLEQKKMITKSNFISYKQESVLMNGTFILELFFNNQWLEIINKK